MTGRPPPSPKPAPRREPSSPFDPTGIDDHQGGIPLGERRPALRATAWISLAVVVIAIAALAWRTVERQAVDRAYADGVQALSAGRVDAARIAFDRVLAKRPEWAAAWRQRGYAAASPEEAIDDFTRAIALDGSDADAFAARGRAWVQARRPAKGIEDFDRALAIGASSGTDAATVTRWRADRGLARVEAGDHGAALDDLRHAADARNTPDDQRRLALALAMTGDWAGAKAAYDRAVASGAQPLWLGERALVSMRLGDDEAAGVDLVRCAQLDPACAELFGTRAGQLARDLGRAPPPGAR
jgi:tetratricopeptide (TPR) repeat protein